MEKKEIDLSKKVDEVKTTFSEFKENVSELVKDMNVDVNDWSFSMEGHKDKTVIDISVKLVITKEVEGEKSGTE
ncbi:MAG: hypothetical protein ACOWW1_00985 [archaeon]